MRAKKLEKFEEEIREIDEENKRREENKIRMSKEWLKDLLKSDFQMYYETPYLNDRLYLHQQGSTSNI